MDRGPAMSLAGLNEIMDMVLYIYNTNVYLCVCVSIVRKLRMNVRMLLVIGGNAIGSNMLKNNSPLASKHAWSEQIDITHN